MLMLPLTLYMGRSVLLFLSPLADLIVILIFTLISSSRRKTRKATEALRANEAAYAEDDKFLRQGNGFERHEKTAQRYLRWSLVCGYACRKLWMCARGQIVTQKNKKGKKVKKRSTDHLWPWLPDLV